MRRGHRLTQVLWSAVSNMHALYSCTEMLRILQFSIEGIPYLKHSLALAHSAQLLSPSVLTA